MTRPQLYAPMLAAVVVAIGCGSGTPQDAAATTQAVESKAPMQVAEAPVAGQSAVTGSASIRGAVTLTGAAPAAEKVKMDADPVCQQQHAAPVMTDNVVVNNGALKNVLVYVKEGAAGPFPASTAPVTLGQTGCWYAPHVFGIQVNQPLEIVNSDATLHNINAKPVSNPPFNVAQPTKGMKTTKKFTKPELGVKFKCNVHPWMSAYGHVVAHPYFSVSGQDGTFAITGLPAGTYVLEAWHETYGTRTQTVSVADGDAKSVAFTFRAP